MLHRPTVTGTNHPANQVSKDVWNDRHIITVAALGEIDPTPLAEGTIVAIQAADGSVSLYYRDSDPVFTLLGGEPAAFNYVVCSGTSLTQSSSGPVHVRIEAYRQGLNQVDANGPVAGLVYASPGVSGSFLPVGGDMSYESGHPDGRDMMFDQRGTAAFITDDEGVADLVLDYDRTLGDFEQAQFHLVFVLPFGKLFEAEHTIAFSAQQNLTPVVWEDHEVTDVWDDLHGYTAGEYIAVTDDVGAGSVWVTGNIGTSGGVEPTWTGGGTEREDGSIFWSRVEAWEGSSPSSDGTHPTAPFVTVVQPITPNGHRYVCITSGTTGASEPAFPTDGGTVEDGDPGPVTFQDIDLTVALWGPGASHTTGDKLWDGDFDNGRIWLCYGTTIGGDTGLTGSTVPQWSGSNEVVVDGEIVWRRAENYEALHRYPVDVKLDQFVHNYGHFIAPNIPNGHVYQVITSGTSGDPEPDPWPTDGSSFNDPLF